MVLDDRGIVVTKHATTCMTTPYIHIQYYIPRPRCSSCSSSIMFLLIYFRKTRLLDSTVELTRLLPYYCIVMVYVLLTGTTFFLFS
jgi:hypothetical protein